MTTNGSDRYGVMGNPIAHSKSPAIHTAFARQTGQRLSYDAILVEPGTFDAAVEGFQREGGKGLNITVPFKQDAHRIAQRHSPRAARAQAVNTLKFLADGTRYGDNTDGVGLLRDLIRNHGQVLQGKRLLLLGAGGAARGILAPLLEQGPSALVIANRTPARAVELAQAFTDLGTVQGCGFTDLDAQPFDLILNATSASLQGEVPPLPEGVLRPGGCCYDLMYAAQPTPFLRWAESHGAGMAIDGLGMLVEQAAESFYLWREVRPDTGPVIDRLRRSISA